MAINYLWDTNIVIYYLQQQFPANGEKFMDKINVLNQPCLSVITEIELLCWKTNNEKDLLIINQFIDDALVLDIDKNIKLKTVNLRKKYKIKLPDAIIAATALVYDYTLITNNEKDFIAIDNLKIINPHKI